MLERLRERVRALRRGVHRCALQEMTDERIEPRDHGDGRAAHVDGVAAREEHERVDVDVDEATVPQRALHPKRVVVGAERWRISQRMRHHPDTATLRREVIMNKLMARANGVYWRIDGDTPEQPE